jgi:hypothetical protein
MKKVLLTILASLLLFSFGSNGQKIHHKDMGQPIDKKISNALRYDYQLTTKDSADYAIEVFFKGSYSFVSRGYSGFYKLYNKSDELVYTSKEWKTGGYGGVAENYIVKKVIEKDLPKALKSISENQNN